MEPKKLATFSFNKADSKTACEFRFKKKKNSLNCADRDENLRPPRNKNKDGLISAQTVARWQQRADGNQVSLVWQRRAGVECGRS